MPPCLHHSQLGLEDILQRELDVTAGPSAIDLAECAQWIRCRVVVSIDVGPLGVVEGIEHFPAEFDVLVFSNQDFLENRNIPIVDARLADDVASGIAAVIRNAIPIEIGRIHKSTGIEVAGESPFSSGQIPIA